MSDRRLRELGRLYLEGDPDVQRAYMAEALRQGIYSNTRIAVLWNLLEPALVEIRGLPNLEPRDMLSGITAALYFEMQGLGTSDVQFMKRMLEACANSCAALVDYFWAPVAEAKEPWLRFGDDVPDSVVVAARRAARPGQPVSSPWEVTAIEQRYHRDRVRLLGQDIGDMVIHDPSAEARRVDYAESFFAIQRPLIWLIACARDTYEVSRGRDVRFDGFNRFLVNTYESYNMEGGYSEEDSLELTLRPMRQTLIPWLLELA